MMTEQKMDPVEKASAWEYGAAAAIFLLGLYILSEGVDIGVGSLRRMGPGFLPVAVGGAMAALALAIMVRLRRGGIARIDIPLRPLIMVALSLAAFAATVGTLGLVPATLLLVFIGAFADRGMTILCAGSSAVTMAVFGYVVFILGFGLPLHAFGG